MLSAAGRQFVPVARDLATLHSDDPLPAVSEEPPQLIYAALQSGADLAICVER